MTFSSIHSYLKHIPMMANPDFHWIVAHIAFSYLAFPDFDFFMRRITPVYLKPAHMKSTIITI